MRKIIACIATSADGYIARPDGGVDWLNDPRIAGGHGMDVFLRSIDTVLWGRKTWDLALRRSKNAEISGPKVKHYVFSKRRKGSPKPGVEFVNKRVTAFARHLRSTPGKNVWLMGGGGIIASFLDAGQIDEFIIHLAALAGLAASGSCRAAQGRAFRALPSRGPGRVRRVSGDSNGGRAPTGRVRSACA